SFTDHTTRAAQALPPRTSQEPRTVNPLFAATLQRCETALRQAPSHPGAIARQPWAVSWAVQVAVASVLRDWGIEPDLLQGHGTGRLAAATVDGALSIEDAAALVADHDGTWLPSYVVARLQVWQGGERPMVRIEIDADRLGSAGLHRAVAEAYVAGRHPRWDRVLRGGRYTWIPTYPWQRQRYWVDRAVSPTPGGSPTRPSDTRRAS
ncbi:MAG: hypothetical protein ACRDTC_12135, partial [Pseudonocardiaceae bacterium]